MLSILDPARHRQLPSRRGTLRAGLVASAGVLVLGALHVSATTETTASRVRDYSIPEWSRNVEQDTRERVAGALTAALNDENEQVRQAASDALDVIRQQPDGRIVVTSPCRGNCVVADDTVWTVLWNLWISRGLSSPDAAIRQRTLMNGGLFFRGTKSGAQTLAGVLMDRDPGVRMWAAIRLDSVRSVETVPAWISLLNDADASLRERAAISLGVVGDPLAVDPLSSTLLNDADPVVRRQAARGLGFIASGGGD